MSGPCVELGICWDAASKSLNVSAQFRNDLDVVDRVTVILLHIFEFRKFSDSRWLSLGSSMRTLVASMVFGLEELKSFGIHTKQVVWMRQ